MDIRVLNTNLEGIGFLESFVSIIWTDRYSFCGDFEIIVPLNSSSYSLLENGNYILLDSSDHVMLVESISIKTDELDGAFLTAKGRSLESILDRRIVWSHTVLNGNLQTEMARLLNENAINPTDADRKINRLKFTASTDVEITNLEIDGQYLGNSLYDVVSEICTANNIGFKITLDSNNDFVFQLYSGIDRSYSQDLNPYVCFSPAFENLRNSEYVYNNASEKNVALVGGEGEGSNRILMPISLEDGISDLDRKEIFIEARNVSKTTSSGTLSTEDYYLHLAEKGFESLIDSTAIKSFDGEADFDTMYKYGEDFFLGDIVQLANEYGLGAPSRINEVTFSEDSTGRMIYPAFKSL